MDYKAEHEKFVSGLEGGTLGEILLMLSVIPVS